MKVNTFYGKLNQKIVNASKLRSNYPTEKSSESPTSLKQNHAHAHIRSLRGNFSFSFLAEPDFELGSKQTRRKQDQQISEKWTLSQDSKTK